MSYWNTRDGLRGSALENIINITNNLYLRKGVAVIQKIATPIIPIEVNNSKHIISKAYFEKKSTVDYIGAAGGKPLCFDAKETTRSALPLQNIHSHQMEFMEAFQNQGGVSFLLVSFGNDDVYFFNFSILKEFWSASRNGGRKSVPKNIFSPTMKVTNEQGFPLHYLKYV